MNRVFVIEDNPDNMALMVFLLNKSGYRHVPACDGRSGIEFARQGGFDLVLLDIKLPDMDGNEVLGRIRSMEHGALVPIIAMTSYAMSGDRERLLAAGCNGYVEKPIDPLLVIQHIQAVLAASV